MTNKLFILMIVVLLKIGFPILSQAQWHFQPAEIAYGYNPGESFTFEIILSDSGTDVDAFGFDVNFPNDLIQYDTLDFTGTLIDGWTLKDANEYKPGVLKVAGLNLSSPITHPAAGIWVKLNFTVKNGVSGAGEFTIGEFGDDLLADGSISSSASFTVIPTSVFEDEKGFIPDIFVLSPNYPNPFNPSTNISFQLPIDEWVELGIYNNLGKKVRTLADQKYAKGQHTLVWDGKNNRGKGVVSGIYIYKITAGKFTQTRKMNLVR